MKTIVLKLDKNSVNVPLLPIKLKAVNLTIIALIDTGASIPVWVGSKQILLKLNAIPKDKKVPISGFGGETYGDLYEIPVFNIGELIFAGLSIVYCENFFSRFNKDGNNVSTEAAYHMILSATMFRNTVYEIDDINKSFKITVQDNNLVRNLKLYSSDGKEFKVLFTL